MALAWTSYKRGENYNVPAFQGPTHRKKSVYIYIHNIYIYVTNKSVKRGGLKNAVSRLKCPLRAGWNALVKKTFVAFSEVTDPSVHI